MHAAADTLVAAATAPAPAGVAIVRLSGPRAIAIAARLAGRPESALVHGHMRFGALRDGAGGVLDRGYTVAFRGPRSFTGEDVAEFHVHGSPAVVARVIEAACALGARPAAAGEFSARAFHYGRLDLVQAEALMDLVSARSESARLAALDHLDGALGRRLLALRQPLLAILADLEARLDFGSEDGVGEVDRVQLIRTIAELAADIEALRATARAGRVRLHGARVVLFGAPNAGKSTLFNALCGAERALVDARPGTTRDTIEVLAAPEGVPLTWVDTAGVRDTADPVEAQGTARARAEAAHADVVLWLQDGAAPPCTLPDPGAGDSLPVVLDVCSKADQGAHPQVAAQPRWQAALRVSAHPGQGVAALQAAVVAAVRALAEPGRTNGVAITRERHAEGLRQASEALLRAGDALGEGLPLELVAADVRDAADALGEMTGAVVADDVLAAVFSRFCIGK